MGPVNRGAATLPPVSGLPTSSLGAKGSAASPGAAAPFQYPQPPQGVQTINPALSGGYYNQMAQMMAGPNYQVPHFHFTGTTPGGIGSTPGPANGNGAGNFNPNTGYGPGASGTGALGAYGFGGPGGITGDIGGMGSYAPLVGGGGSYANGSPTSLTLGGGNVTGGNEGGFSLLGSMMGGKLGSLLGPIGSLGGSILGGMSGALSNTTPGGLQKTSVPLPTSTVNLAQPIINPATGMPYGSAYFSTPAGQQAMQENLMQQNQIAALQGQSLGNNNMAQKSFGRGYSYID